MRLVLTVITAIVLTLAGNASATQCRDHTIFFPDGRMLRCETCCYRNGDCETRCW
jgi:hypothetical protein